MNFDEYWKNETHWDDPGAIANKAWDAAMKEFKKNPPEGLYRIGEEVELLDDGAWVIATVAADNASQFTTNPAEVRRKPAWAPKDGEAVLFERNKKAACGIYANGYIYFGNNRTFARDVKHKHFDSEKYDKPWDEV